MCRGAPEPIPGEGIAANRRQLIEALAAHYEGNRLQAGQALDAVLDTVTREVARGEKVAGQGFGPRLRVNQTSGRFSRGVVFA